MGEELRQPGDSVQGRYHGSGPSRQESERDKYIVQKWTCVSCTCFHQVVSLCLSDCLLSRTCAHCPCVLYFLSYIRLFFFVRTDLPLSMIQGKYSNGFCHWPQPAWTKPDGTWQPSLAHFTSLADPAAIGSGHTALTTLMHEAGHAGASVRAFLRTCVRVRVQERECVKRCMRALE